MKALAPIRRIKVLFLIHRFVQGGAEQQLFELVRGINKAKFEVIVGCLVPGGAKWEEFHALPDVRVVCFDRRHKCNVFVWWQILAFLKQNPVDILHAYLPPATFYGIIAGLLAQTPLLIIGERGTETRFPTFGSRIYYTLESLMARYVDLIIANSTAGKQWKMEAGIDAGRIAVIPNGLNPDRLRPRRTCKRSTVGLKENDLVLGNVSRLVPMKDHLTLLKAIELLRQEYPEIHCLLIGDGPLRESLEHYVQQSGLSRSVCFLGHQEHVADYIALFDVAVLSSKHTEGCSNFILEAMYCGKPVVATDVGGARELVVHGETGFVVNKEDPRSLAAAIGMLLRDEQMRQNFGHAGRHRIERDFLLEKMIRATEEVYERFLWRHPHSASKYPRLKPVDSL